MVESAGQRVGEEDGGDRAELWCEGKKTVRIGPSDGAREIRR